MSYEAFQVPYIHGDSYKDVYVSLPTSKMLKEIGFEVAVRMSVTEYETERVHETDGTSGPFGWKKGELSMDSSFFCNNSDFDYSCDSYTQYAVPTQAIVQFWLREVHGIKIWISPNTFSSKGSDWVYNIIAYEDGKLIHETKEESHEKHITYEVALEMGIQEALHMIENE